MTLRPPRCAAIQHRASARQSLPSSGQCRASGVDDEIMPGKTAAVLDPPTFLERPRRGLTSTALARLIQLPRRAPLTTCLIVALWGVGAATNSLVDGPPAGWHIGLGRDALAHARWWTPFSALLWCPGLTAYLTVTAAMIVLMGPAEARMGTARAALVGATAQLSSAIVVSGIIAAGVG